MRWPRMLSGLAAGLLACAAAFVAAPAASADSVWFQSVARASSSAPCPDDSFGTPWQSNWDPAQRSWRPSWAQWPNGGSGGFTCDRQITWAKSGYPSAGCVAYLDTDLTGTKYVNFGGGWSIGVGPRYTDAACTILYNAGGASGTSPINLYFVYAPSGWSAVDLCRQAFGLGPAGVSPAGSYGVYFCQATVG